MTYKVLGCKLELPPSRCVRVFSADFGPNGHIVKSWEEARRHFITCVHEDRHCHVVRQWQIDEGTSTQRTGQVTVWSFEPKTGDV